MVKPYMKRAAPYNQDFSTVPTEQNGSGVGMIYFIGSEDGERIKVGYSGDSKKEFARLKAHAKGDVFGKGGNYEILALVRGQQCHESAVHQYFTSAKVQGITNQEVFETATLLPYVCWLRDQYFVSISEEEYYSERGQTIIDASLWLPNPQRISNRRAESNLFSSQNAWNILPNRDITGDDYYTPPDIIHIAHLLFDKIDLDPASHVQANSIVQASNFYTRDQNGLNQKWFGKVWLNPPFSAWQLWAEKARTEYNCGNVEEIVLLAATRTMTANYFRLLLSEVDAIAILTGRYGFWGISNASTPPDGHFLMYRGPNVARFTCSCADKAVVFLSPSLTLPGGRDATNLNSGIEVEHS